jgi:hypothetical protein
VVKAEVAEKSGVRGWVGRRGKVYERKSERERTR